MLNQQSELKETKNIIVVHYMSKTPKQVLNITCTPKIAHLGAKKSKKNQNVGQKQKLILKEAQKIKGFPLYD